MECCFSCIFQGINVPMSRAIRIALNVVRSRLARQHRGTRPWTRPSFCRDIALATRSHQSPLRSIVSSMVASPLQPPVDYANSASLLQHHPTFCSSGNALIRQPDHATLKRSPHDQARPAALAWFFVSARILTALSDDRAMKATSCSSRGISPNAQRPGITYAHAQS